MKSLLWHHIIMKTTKISWTKCFYNNSFSTRLIFINIGSNGYSWYNIRCIITINTLSITTILKFSLWNRRINTHFKYNWLLLIFIKKLDSYFIVRTIIKNVHWIYNQIVINTDFNIVLQIFINSVIFNVFFNRVLSFTRFFIITKNFLNLNWSQQSFKRRSSK